MKLSDSAMKFSFSPLCCSLPSLAALLLKSADALTYKCILEFISLKYWFIKFNCCYSAEDNSVVIPPTFYVLKI